MFRVSRYVWAPLAAILLAPPPAFAAPSRDPGAQWSRLALPARVRAGELVSVALPEAPPGVEEMEVLLSLDGGRTFPVRVTRDARAWGRFVRWQVPNRAAERAAMRLRYRRHGRETDGVPSAPFEIIADPARAPDFALPLDREAERELDRDGFGLERRLDPDRAASLRAADELPAEPPTPSLPVGSPVVAHARISRATPARSAPRASHFTQESFQPLRN